MCLFFRVRENRIFIMSDFREFFHAQHRATGSKGQFTLSIHFGIELRELLIFKGRHETTRFSPYLSLFSEFSKEILIVFLWKRQNLWAGEIYIFPFFSIATHPLLLVVIHAYWSGQGINAAKPSLETNSKN